MEMAFSIPRLVAMAKPIITFASHRHGESYGVGTWREGGEWHEHATIILVKNLGDYVFGVIMCSLDA